MSYSQLTKDQRKEVANAYFKHMLSGICWVVGGAVLTALTLSIGHGHGILFCGAIVFGAVDFFRGLFGFIRYSL